MPPEQTDTAQQSAEQNSTVGSGLKVMGAVSGAVVGLDGGIQGNAGGTLNAGAGGALAAGAGGGAPNNAEASGDSGAGGGAGVGDANSQQLSPLGQAIKANAEKMRAPPRADAALSVEERVEHAIAHVFQLTLHALSEADKAIVAEAHRLLTSLSFRSSNT